MSTVQVVIGYTATRELTSRHYAGFSEGWHDKDNAVAPCDTLPCIMGPCPSHICGAFGFLSISNRAIATSVTGSGCHSTTHDVASLVLERMSQHPHLWNGRGHWGQTCCAARVMPLHHMLSPPPSVCCACPDGLFTLVPECRIVACTNR